MDKLPTLDETISIIPNELATDAVGLWQVVGILRDDYRLTGHELDRCVREVIKALINAGAYPLSGRKSGEKGWEIDKSYGQSPEEIAEAVVKEWRASGEDYPSAGGIWFGTEIFLKSSHRFTNRNS